ncbi:MAG TPA: tetratricopeptide repeat protein [Desulfuromonadales bacterium]|nr:tetratricopeptide repeat protein [Desulfuromonadales bacterium]
MKLPAYVLVLIVCLMFSACARLPGTPTTPTAAPEKIPVRPDVKTSSQERHHKQVKTELQRHSADRNYTAVLKLIEEQLRAGASQIDFSPEYSDALNALSRQARQHKAQNRLTSAGQAFRQVLEQYPSDPQVSAQIDMTPEQLEKALANCSEKMMEQGLIAYRAGRLSKAIEAWEKILTFSPSHQPAIKAIRTVKIQRENLKALEGEQERD